MRKIVWIKGRMELVINLEKALGKLARKGSGIWRRTEKVTVKVKDEYMEIPLRHKNGVIYVDIDGNELMYTQRMVR